MQDVADSGRTVIFVSHNMAAVHKLCNSGVLLRKGKVVAAGPIDVVLQEYIASNKASTTIGTANKFGISLAELSLYDTQTQSITNEPAFDRDHELHVRLEANDGFVGGALVCEVRDEMDVLVASLCSLEEGLDTLNFSKSCEVVFPIPRLQLFPANYKINVLLYKTNDNTKYLDEQNALTFSVQPSHVHGGAWSYQSKHGFVRVSDGAAAVTDGQARFGVLGSIMSSSDEKILNGVK